MRLEKRQNHVLRMSEKRTRSYTESSGWNGARTTDEKAWSMGHTTIWSLEVNEGTVQ
jgi:hypothetical protein